MNRRIALCALLIYAMICTGTAENQGGMRELTPETGSIMAGMCLLIKLPWL